MLDASGRVVVSLYPSQALAPSLYYQMWFESDNGRREFLGLYDIPASAETMLIWGNNFGTNLTLDNVSADEGQSVSLSVSAIVNIKQGEARSVRVLAAGGYSYTSLAPTKTLDIGRHKTARRGDYFLGRVGARERGRAEALNDDS